MLFQGAEAKNDLQHFLKVNEKGHTQATTDVFLTLKIEYSRCNFSFK